MNHHYGHVVTLSAVCWFEGNISTSLQTAGINTAFPAQSRGVIEGRRGPVRVDLSFGSLRSPATDEQLMDTIHTVVFERVILSYSRFPHSEPEISQGKHFLKGLLMRAQGAVDQWFVVSQSEM